MSDHVGSIGVLGGVSGAASVLGGLSCAKGLLCNYSRDSGLKYYIQSHRKHQVDMYADSILKVLNMIPPIRARIRKVHIPLGRAPRSRHDRELIRLPPLHIAHGFFLGHRSLNEGPGWPLRAGYLVRMSDARRSRSEEQATCTIPRQFWRMEDASDPSPTL